MSDNILENAEFENQIRQLTDRQLSEFTARKIASMCVLCDEHTKEISELQDRDKKAFGIVGGIGGIIGTTLGTAFLYIYERLKGG